MHDITGVGASTFCVGGGVGAEGAAEVVAVDVTLVSVGGGVGIVGVGGDGGVMVVDAGGVGGGGVVLASRPRGCRYGHRACSGHCCQRQGAQSTFALLVQQCKY